MRVLRVDATRKSSPVNRQRYIDGVTQAGSIGIMWWALQARATAQQTSAHEEMAFVFCAVSMMVVWFVERPRQRQTRYAMPRAAATEGW